MSNDVNRHTISAEELSGFCGQIAMMLDAGVPIYDGIEMLADADENRKNDDIYNLLRLRVNEMGSLYAALKSDDRWPRYMVEMTGIGEETGHLDKVMRGLQRFYAREDKIRSAVAHAIAYPLLLGGLLMIVVFVMLWKVLPMFRQVLESMGIGATQSGSRLMNLGATIGWAVLVVFGVLFIAAVICLLLTRTAARPKIIFFLRRTLVSMRRFTKRISAARIASVLGMTLGSGYPVSQALEMLKLVMDDGDAEIRLAAASKRIDDGTPVASALSESGIFEPLHGRMLKVASVSGQEEQTLEELSAIYEERAEDAVERLISVIEPTLVAVMSVVIGAILLSVMLPMAGLLTSML